MEALAAVVVLGALILGAADIITPLVVLVVIVLALGPFALFS